MLSITADTLDYTFDNTPTAFWSCVETNATVVVACFMTFKPLLAKWFPKLTEPSRDNSNTPNYQGVMADLNGRVPTIGSRPSRPVMADPQQSWMFMDTIAEHDQKDCEAGPVDVHDSKGATDRSVASENFAPTASLEQQPGSRLA